MLSVWRITSKKFTKSAFKGEGARLFGGRWNTPGTPLIYTAESKSLAVLEILVHLDSPDLLRKYVLFEVRVEDRLVTHLDVASLPDNWCEDPPPAAAQNIGDEWASSARSAVLRVPSPIVTGEFNFLLNPRHPDFGKLKIGPPQSFFIDPRLERHKKS
ncbi:MAG TPA: RES family NAD+ phosphorylase, partial [Terriglobia bacterium]|nr:RES family NAD+ phosphorylase [Terriglobia bacterium]